MKICKRCLLEDMDENEYIRSLKEYIAAYPEEKKADEETVRQRLEICRSCDHLANGMCRKCGCYVELRCIKKESYCPDVPPKWAGSACSHFRGGVPPLSSRDHN